MQLSEQYWPGKTWKVLCHGLGKVASNCRVLHFGSTHCSFQWNRVLVQKLRVSQLVKKYSAFYETQNFIPVSTSASHLFLVWSKPIQSTFSHFISLRIILMLCSHLLLSLRSIPFPHVSSPKQCRKQNNRKCSSPGCSLSNDDSSCTFFFRFPIPKCYLLHGAESFLNS